MAWHDHVICLLVPQATWFTGGADVRLRFWHDSQGMSIIFCYYCIRVTHGTHFKENASEYDVCKILAISSRSQRVNLSFRTLTGASGAMLLRFLSNFRVIGIGQFLTHILWLSDFTDQATRSLAAQWTMTLFCMGSILLGHSYLHIGYAAD